MAKCDLCGSDCSAAKLAQLLTKYQGSGVVDICPDCERWAVKLKSDMLLEIAPRMREAISKRKGEPKQQESKQWWRRLAALIGS